MGVAVAFFMSVFSASLYNTDHGHDNADNRYNNTDQADNEFDIQIYVPFIIFSIFVSPPRYRKFSEQVILAKGEPLPVLVTLSMV